MKKLLTLLLTLLVAASACSGAKVSFKVTGANAPKDGAAVQVVDMLSGSAIASGAVSKGAFELKGKAEKNAFLAVAVEGIDWAFQFFNDGKPVQVNVAERSVGGSALNAKLSDCALKNAEEYDKYYGYVESFMALPGKEQEAKMEEFMSEYRTRIKVYADFYMGMIEDNKDNLIPVAFIEHLPSLMSAASEWDKAKGDKALDDLLTSNAPCAKHPYVLAFKQKVAEADAQRAAASAQQKQAQAGAQALVGQKFLDLEEPDQNGKMHKLSEYVGKGKWVLVDFWASWCNPCKVEMPNVVAAYKKYHAKGFEIVGLSFDRGKEEWVKAIKDWDMPWIHLSDLKYWQSIAAQTYTVTGIPDNLLISPDGTIVARGLRGRALEAKLAEIFK